MSAFVDDEVSEWMTDCVAWLVGLVRFVLSRRFNDLPALMRLPGRLAPCVAVRVCVCLGGWVAARMSECQE